MPIEETITVSLLKETGYSTWFDFVFNITGSSCSYEMHTYGYRDAQGVKKDIQLKIGNVLLERLALEEAKLRLPLINIPSFAAFDELAKNNKIWMGEQLYHFDVIARDKEGRCLLKRLQYRVEEIERLQKWEKKYETERVYIEKQEPQSPLGK
jgi:hypothetical protein